jgi:hypothetical protein
MILVKDADLNLLSWRVALLLSEGPLSNDPLPRNRSGNVLELSEFIPSDVD